MQKTFKSIKTMMWRKCWLSSWLLQSAHYNRDPNTGLVSKVNGKFLLWVVYFTLSDVYKVKAVFVMVQDRTTQITCKILYFVTSMLLNQPQHEIGQSCANSPRKEAFRLHRALSTNMYDYTLPIKCSLLTLFWPNNHKRVLMKEKKK